MSTQEKLEEQIGMILFHYFQGKERPSVIDAQNAISEIMPLIDTATREARIDELKRLKGFDSFNEPYTWQGDSRPGKMVDYRLHQLQEQSGGEKNE